MVIFLNYLRNSFAYFDNRNLYYIYIGLKCTVNVKDDNRKLMEYNMTISESVSF